MKILGKIIALVGVLFIMMVAAQFIAPYTEKNSWAGLVVFAAFIVWTLVMVYTLAEAIPMAGGSVKIVQHPVQLAAGPQTYQHTEETHIMIGYSEEEFQMALAQQAQQFTDGMVRMGQHALEAQARAYEAGLYYQHQAHEAEMGRMERMYLGYSTQQQQTINSLFKLLSPKEQEVMAWQFNHGATLDLLPVEVSEGKFYEIPLEEGLTMRGVLKQQGQPIANLSPDQVRFWMALESGEAPALPAPKK